MGNKVVYIVAVGFFLVLAGIMANYVNILRSTLAPSVSSSNSIIYTATNNAGTEPTIYGSSVPHYLEVIENMYRDSENPSLIHIGLDINSDIVVGSTYEAYVQLLKTRNIGLGNEYGYDANGDIDVRVYRIYLDWIEWLASIDGRNWMNGTEEGVDWRNNLLAAAGTIIGHNISADIEYDIRVENGVLYIMEREE